MLSVTKSHLLCGISQNAHWQLYVGSPYTEEQADEGSSYLRGCYADLHWFLQPAQLLITIAELIVMCWSCTCQMKQDTGHNLQQC